VSKFPGTTQMNKHECKSKKRFWRKVTFITIGVSGIDFLRHHLDDKEQVASGWGRIKFFSQGPLSYKLAATFDLAVQSCSNLFLSVAIVFAIWVWIKTYLTIMQRMNIHLPAILVFTRVTGF